MSKFEPIYSGPKLKTTTLGRVRVSPRLIELLDEYCKQNGEKNRSRVVRRAIVKEIDLRSIEDLIACEKPFMKRKEENVNHEW